MLVRDLDCIGTLGLGGAVGKNLVFFARDKRPCRETADLQSTELFLFTPAVFFSAIIRQSSSSLLFLPRSSVIFHLLIVCVRVYETDGDSVEEILYLIYGNNPKGNLYNKRLCKNHRTTRGHRPAHPSSRTSLYREHAELSQHGTEAPGCLCAHTWGQTLLKPADVKLPTLLYVGECRDCRSLHRALTKSQKHVRFCLCTFALLSCLCLIVIVSERNTVLHIVWMFGMSCLQAARGGHPGCLRWLLST